MNVTRRPGIYCISDDVDLQTTPTSYALSHVLQHGTPFVLLVHADGTIVHEDRRGGWRELVHTIAPMHGMTLPPPLVRLISRHAANPPAGNAASVIVAGQGVMVNVIALHGVPMYAVLLLRIDREGVLDSARSRYLLTNREVELLDRILYGDSASEIGKLISISPDTVEWHTKRLLSKTESTNRTQMTARVLGWLTDEH